MQSGLTDPLYVLAGMPLSPGDLFGFVSGILCVWLAARGNIWNFPVGILNSLVLGVVFLERRLFADAALQVIFIWLGVRGWQRWRGQASGAADAPVLRSSRRCLWQLGLAAAATTCVLWAVLRQLHGSAPFIDAGVTSFSLAAQWLLNTRRLETWAFWIAVDVVSIPLYWSRDLPLIAALYCLFLLLCIHGFVRWRKQALPRAEASLQ